MEKIIEIPEGYEARVEGNKVVIEPKNEDERIRRHIVKFIDEQYPTHGSLKEEKEKMLAYLEKQKEQQPAEWSEEEKIRIGLINYFKRRDSYRDDDETFYGMKYHDIVAYLEKQKEHKPAEWSEEDTEMYINVASSLRGYACGLENEEHKRHIQRGLAWLESRFKSLRPQPKQESEPIEIKFAGKIYKVYGTKELPGDVVGYIIEDEPGHYDCIINPDEVLGGGYGIKSNGSPYPTKETNFGQPHWKPSEKLKNLPIEGGDSLR